MREWAADAARDVVESVRHRTALDAAVLVTEGDLEMEDVFAIQDEIAANIVSALRLVLTDRELARGAQHAVRRLAANLALLDLEATWQHRSRRAPLYGRDRRADAQRRGLERDHRPRPER